MSIRASTSTPELTRQEEEDVVALARRVEAAVVLQTSMQPSGLDAETEAKAAAHMCNAFPACFGLRGAVPQTLNEVAFLIVRHLTQKAEERRMVELRKPKEARVDFLTRKAPARKTWPTHKPHTEINSMILKDFRNTSQFFSMVSVESDPVQEK